MNKTLLLSNVMCITAKGNVLTIVNAKQRPGLPAQIPQTVPHSEPILQQLSSHPCFVRIGDTVVNATHIEQIQYFDINERQNSCDRRRVVYKLDRQNYSIEMSVSEAEGLIKRLCDIGLSPIGAGHRFAIKIDPIAFITDAPIQDIQVGDYTLVQKREGAPVLTRHAASMRQILG